MALSLEPSGLLWWNFVCTLILTGCTPNDHCQMPFVIGRGFAEVQIQMSDTGHFVKFSPDSSRKMPTTLKPSKIFRRNFAYTLILTRSISRDWKWHLSSVEALPRSKFWKSENGPISWTEWNILMKFCIHIDMERSIPRDCEMTFFHWSRLCRTSNSEIVKMALSLELSGILWWNST